MSILIASCSQDEPCWEPVVRSLRDAGQEVWLYLADRVARSQDVLEVRVGGGRTSVPSVVYNGVEWDLSRVGAAWYRRPSLIEVEDDLALRFSLDYERKMLQNSLWQAVPDRAWISTPAAIAKAEYKLTQLLVAQEVGFRVPETVVTNAWDVVAGLPHEELLFKPVYGTIHTASGPKLLYATPVRRGQLKELSAGNPFPGLWQPFLAKAREWRITVIGDDLFAATVYTSVVAKDDWRKHQLDGNEVRFAAERASAATEASCRKYLEAFSLGFGAFDLVETPDGETYFLECNANGQYGWLEDDLGFPMADSLTKQLLTLAANAL